MLPPTYSRRKKQLQGGTPDVYRYNTLPFALRIQVIHIFSEAIGQYIGDNTAGYDHVVKILRKEFGVFNLIGDYADNSREELFTWMQKEANIDHFIDGYELGLRLIDTHI